MNVTGVGSSYSYWYDPSTKKLSTKDGSQDAFVDYFNGDLAEEEYGQLNGYDSKMKNDIEAMIRLFSSGVSGANLFQSDDGVYDISAEIVNGVEAKYSVNGTHSFTGYAAMPYTKSEIQRKADCEKPDFANTMYTTQELKNMMEQAMEERRRNDLEIREHSIHNWANWFNQHHPDLAGKSCFYVNGRWVTPEELQKIWEKELGESNLS